MNTTKTKRNAKGKRQAQQLARAANASDSLDIQDEIGRAVHGAEGLRLAVLGLEERSSRDALDQMVCDHIGRLKAIQHEHEQLRQGAAADGQ